MDNGSPTTRAPSPTLGEGARSRRQVSGRAQVESVISGLCWARRRDPRSVKQREHGVIPPATTRR